MGLGRGDNSGLCGLIQAVSFDFYIVSSLSARWGPGPLNFCPSTGTHCIWKIPLWEKGPWEKMTGEKRGRGLWDPQVEKVEKVPGPKCLRRI